MVSDRPRLYSMISFRIMIEPAVLKGFRDSLPEEEIPKKRIIRILEDVFSSYGFVPIDTPVLEYTEVLLGKGGGETDKQIFRFQDNGDIFPVFFIPASQNQAKRLFLASDDTYPTTLTTDNPDHLTWIQGNDLGGYWGSDCSVSVNGTTTLLENNTENIAP